MIVQHPAFQSVTHDVDNPEDWVAQGWILVEGDPDADPPMVPDDADDTDENPQDYDA